MRSAEVLIVDYGLGNLFNIQAAIESFGGEAIVSDDSKEIKNAKRLIVPGVGAFIDAMNGLHDRDLVKPIQDFAASGKPVLGVCLGAQLLLSQSEEWGLHEGLGIVEGRVVKFRPPLPGVRYKIPHIGWNTMKASGASPILKGVKSNNENEFYMYFIHSYIMNLKDEGAVIASTEYGRDRFCSAFQANNVYGFQPHPERSGEAGLQVYKNFLDL